MKKIVCIVAFTAFLGGCSTLRNTTRSQEDALTLELLSAMSNATCIFVRDKYAAQTQAVVDLIEFGIRPIIVDGADSDQAKAVMGMLFDQEYEVKARDKVVSALEVLSGGHTFEPEVVSQIMKLLRLVSAFVKERQGIFVDEQELWLAAIDAVTSGCREAFST